MNTIPPLPIKPEHIRPATPQEVAQDLERHRQYIAKMLADLDSLRQKWQDELGEPVIAQRQASAV